ncbi:MAG: Rdx family protein [Gemmatimonadetes bacterium]|nr:Rdx family protein [Gemmatimonadota bacterium]
MAAALKDRYDGTEIDLVPSGGGRFEVTCDGELVYSKLATGRHATHEEVFQALD